MANFGMGGYVGTAEDQRRIRRQQNEREEQRRQFEEALKKAEGAPGLRQFGVAKSEAVEQAFKSETVGLVSREEFVGKRQTIAERLEAEAKRQRDEDEEAAWQERELQRAKRSKTDRKSKLSFHDDLEKEDGAGIEDKDARINEENGAEKDSHLTPSVHSRRYATLGKDPTARAEFLPDRDREREEEALRAKLKQEWAKNQAAVKAELLPIVFSYWNGSGHRRQVTVTKGDTVGTFLRAAQEQLAPQFREIRTSSVSGLMYVKEDIILPHTVTFYELISKRAQGRSGPLFQFDLQEHTATTFDPRLKSQDSHAGKVVERVWYSRHKHIFPYSRWEVYDPEKHVPGGGDPGDN